MAELNDLSVTDASNTARFPEGQSPASLNNAARALEGMLAREHKDTNGSLTLAGTGSAFTVALNRDNGLALYDGLEITAEVNTVNTSTTPTLTPTPDGGSALDTDTIKKFGGEALAAGDLPAGHKAKFIFDGTDWLLMNPAIGSNRHDGTAALPAYSFNSDIDTGLYSVSADRLGFSVGGVIKFSVGGNGDGATGEAVGGMAFSGARTGTNTGANMVVDYSSGGRFNIPTGASYAFQIAGTSEATIDATGIGVGVPAVGRGQLALGNSGSCYLAIFDTAQGSTGGVDGMAIGMTGVNMDVINREAGSMTFYTNNIERVRITSGGILDLATGTSGGILTDSQSLPTTDPSVTGQLWNDSGTVKVSA
jgi:hypothetical protein